MARQMRFGVTLPQIKRSWQEGRAGRATWRGKHSTVRAASAEPTRARRPPMPVGGGGERRLMGLGSRHADIGNSRAVFQGERGRRVEARKRRCGEVGREFASIE